MNRTAASLVPAAVPFVPAGTTGPPTSTYDGALAIDQSPYGPDESRVADRQNELGTVLADWGDPADARAYHERAWPLCGGVGPDHPMVAADRGNLNWIVQELEDHERTGAVKKRKNDARRDVSFGYVGQVALPAFLDLGGATGTSGPWLQRTEVPIGLRHRTELRQRYTLGTHPAGR